MHARRERIMFPKTRSDLASHEKNHQYSPVTAQDVVSEVILGPTTVLEDTTT